MSQQKGNDQQVVMQDITLSNDTGGPISFKGRLCSEHSYYDEATGQLSLQRLYETDRGEQAYHVVTGSGEQRQRRAYLLKIEGDLCRVSTGQFEIQVDVNDLSTVVRDLCGLDKGLSAEDLERKTDSDESAVNE